MIPPPFGILAPMNHRISVAWAYAKIAAFAVVTLYLLLVFLWNRSATIDPSLSLPFLATYTRPNAVLALFATSCVAILTVGLIVSFYHAIKTLKTAKEKERLVKAERQVAELQSKAATPPRPMDPIPLEGEGPNAGGTSQSR